MYLAHRRYVLWLSSIFVQLLLQPLGAQVPRTPSSAAAPEAGYTPPFDSDSVRIALQLATITTDTGDYAPGHRDFSRYDTPGLCRAAVHWTRRTLRMGIEAQALLDTMTDLPERDTLPAGVVAVARSCSARFTAANTPLRDLSDFFSVALAGQNESLAQATLSREVAAAPSAALRDSIWLDAINRYLAAEPAQVRMAEAVINTLDALGPSTLVTRLHAHRALLDFWLQVEDAVRIRSEAAQIMMLGQALADRPGWTAGGWDLWDAYRQLAVLALFERPSTLSDLARRAKRDLGRFHADTIRDRRTGALRESERYGEWFHDAAPDSVIDRILPDGFVRAQEDTMYQPVPLHATFQFSVRGDSISQTGDKVILLVETTGCTRGFIYIMGYEKCGMLVNDIRRILVQIDTSKVRVRIVMGTEGYSLLSGPQTGQEEAENLRWYIQDHAHLPVTVTVMAHHFQWLPQPDGRRVVTDTLNPIDEDLWARDVFVRLIGRDGRQSYAGDMYMYKDVYPFAVVNPYFGLLLRTMVAEQGRP